MTETFSDCKLNPELCDTPCRECEWCERMICCDDERLRHARFRGREYSIHICDRCARQWNDLTRDDCVFCGGEAGENTELEYQARLPGYRRVWKPTGVCAACEKEVVA